MSPENPLNPDQLLIQTPIEVIIFPFVSHIMDKSELKCWNEVQLMDKTSLWIAICTFIMYSCSVRQLVNLLTLLLVYLSVHLPIYMSSFWLAKKWACLFFCLSASLLVCPSAFLFVCLHMSASLSVHLFVGLSASLSVCLSACLSICLFVCLSNSLFQPFCLPVSLSASLSVCLSVYLLVCLSVCLSASLSVHLPVFLSIFLSFDPSVHMPASFLVWVARHTIIIGGTTYTTVQQYQAWILMFQAVRSKLPPSSPASPPVADTTLPPEKEKKLRNLKKVKYHFIPQPTQENTKSLKCVLCCQLIKKNTFNKKFEQTHHQKWESINQSLEISIWDTIIS